MFHFSHNQNDEDSFFPHYAKALGTTITEEGRLVFPEKFATGFVQFLPLSNGLKAYLSDYCLNQDFFLQRKATSHEYYVLRMHEMTHPNNLPSNIDAPSWSDRDQPLAATWLGTSLFDVTYIGTCGMTIRGVDIIITREWMAAYLGINSKDEVLQRYLSMKTGSYNFEPMDAVYRELLNAIIEDEQSEAPMKKAIIENRIMELVERFFIRLYERMEQKSDKNLLKPDEIRRIMEAEALLVREFSQPAPTIPVLARFAAMSETKFKTLFKRIYDCGPYEYFQKNRMLRARYLLMVKKISIKETGIQLGYNNLSNFTIAFKKAFNVLPSELRH